VNGVAAVFYRDFLQRLTNLSFAVWDLFVPALYLILFGVGFEKAMGGGFAVGGVSTGYADFFLPGVLAMSTFTIAMNTSWGFFMDKDSGIFYELLTYPITRRQLLLGKIAFNVLLGCLGSLILLGLGAGALDVPVRWGWWLSPPPDGSSFSASWRCACAAWIRSTLSPARPTSC
jgi:ABC-2 type transport system permease protein